MREKDLPASPPPARIVKPARSSADLLNPNMERVAPLRDVVPTPREPPKEDMLSLAAQDYTPRAVS